MSLYLKRGINGYLFECERGAVACFLRERSTAKERMRAWFYVKNIMERGEFTKHQVVPLLQRQTE